MTSVTDTGNIVYNINDVPDSRNVTDSGLQVSATFLKTPSRNACHSCGATVPPAEPLYLIRRWREETIWECEACYEGPSGGYHKHPFHITPVMVPPTPELAAVIAERGPDDPDVRHYLERKPCACGRDLLAIWDGWYSGGLPDITDGKTYSLCQACGRQLGRTNYWPDRNCSPECRRELRNSRRRVTRSKPTCETCGGTFTPPRSDGRYCSPACRQKAYRQRKATP